MIDQKMIKLLVQMLGGPHARDAANAIKLLSKNGMSYKLLIRSEISRAEQLP